MSLRYTITQEDSILTVRTEGVFDFLAAYEMWEKIFVASVKHDCFRILGLSNLDEPIADLDAYEHVGILESVGITGRHRIAWVAVKPTLMEPLQVIEMVAKNRYSLNLKIFANHKSAMRWLTADN